MHFSAVFSFDGFYALCHIWSAVLLFMNYHLAPEQVPLVIVVAHAISSLAFYFTALWLHCSQTLVVQETPLVKDVELTCSLTSPVHSCHMPTNRTHVVGLALLNLLAYLQGGMDVAPFLSEGLRCVTWNT